MSIAQGKGRYIVFSITALLVLAADQLSKWAVDKFVAPNEAIPVWPGFFDLVNIRNRGAAFGFLNRSDIEWQFWLFLFATLIAVWAIVILLRGSKGQLMLCIGLGLIMGGALGNLIDRLLYRAVIDFLDFYWRDWHWPAFNVADIGICVGAGLACLAVWRKKPGGAS